MIKLSFSMLMRIAALMAACVLVGCGGASSTVNPLTPTRVIAFGDAFSTVDSSGYATYSVNTSETNATIASRIASIYGFTLKAVASSSAVIASGTAYSYAAGTATSSATATQISNYLANNTPGSKDLFIITAGTQDIISAAPTNNTTAIATAATALTSAIQTLTNAGAQYVVVMQPINVARTPPFLALNGVRPAGANASYNSYAQALSYDSGTACQSFSCLLSTKLNTAYPATSSHQPILLVDLLSYFNLITGTTNTGSANTFSSYGVANPDLVVCSTAVPSCTTSTLASTSTNQYTSTSWDYTNSIFAYDYYTTPFANRLMGDYIYNYNFYRAGWR
jgi:outer membrane lipase/esterase